MLLLPSKARKIMTSFSLIVLIFAFSTEAQDKRRYVPTKDSEVAISVNSGRAAKYTIDKKEIKFLIWNLYKGEKPSFVKDFKALTKGKDILLLQEMITDDRMMGAMHEDSKRTYYMAATFFDSKKKWARAGSGTASEYRPLEVKWLRSKYNEPVIGTAKMLHIATFDLANSSEDLMTLTIHAVNFVSVTVLKSQLKQAAKEIATHQGPVLFGGDFNTWSKGKIKVMEQVLKAVGLTEVPFGPGRMITLGYPLDHVWTRGLKINYSKVYADIQGSDHKALEVGVSLL